MQLPEQLREAILRACQGTARSALAGAAKSLSAAYREQGRPSGAGGRLTAEQVQAYAITRMPATYAAIRRVLAELPGDGRVGTVLDVGAGTGAGAWAARLALGPEVQIQCAERDREMAAMGRRLASFANWHPDLQKADLVLLSYVLGEVPDMASFARQAWANAVRYLVILEPGTPRGFERIAMLRALGGYIVAPCPHMGACPILADENVKQDWCHFAARVERTALHRQLKGGSLAHEDEKFSYLILSREQPVSEAHARIVRHPQVAPGEIGLRLCAQSGVLEDRTVRKRSQPDAFRKARKASWGDKWPAAK